MPEVSWNFLILTFTHKKQPSMKRLKVTKEVELERHNTDYSLTEGTRNFFLEANR